MDLAVMKRPFMEKVISIITYFSKTDDFESTIRPHMLRLYRLAYRLTDSGPDAEDLVQDVLVKLYPKRRQLFTVEKPGPWLAKILYRTFLDQQRRNKRSPLHLVATPHDSSLEMLDIMASQEPGPEEDTEKKESSRRVQAAINSLNEAQRHLCLLYYVEGYTLAELTEILDTPMGTLKSRLHRSRDNLRNFMNKGTIVHDEPL